jgi:hypothetical protein
MLYKTSEIQGYQLEARDGAIGRIKDFLFDDESWTIQYIVADTNRWLPGRRVLLSPSAAMAGMAHDGKVPIDLTKEQIEKSPSEAADKPVSAQHQRDLHAYYGWPAYWSAGPYPVAGVFSAAPLDGTPPVTDPRDTGIGETPGDPHLRSADRVTGYGIHATDGTIGHVEDFLADIETWTILAIVVDTRNWLPGRKVVVRPQAIDRVSWSDSEVKVQLTRDAVKSSPEYSPEMKLPEDFAQQFASYYDSLAAAR